MSIVMVMNVCSVDKVWAWMHRLCPCNSVAFWCCDAVDRVLSEHDPPDPDAHSGRISLSDALGGLGMNASDLAILLEQQSLSGCTHAGACLAVTGALWDHKGLYRLGMDALVAVGYSKSSLVFGHGGSSAFVAHALGTRSGYGLGMDAPVTVCSTEILSCRSACEQSYRESTELKSGPWVLE